MAGRFSVEAVFSAIDRMTGPIKKMESGAARSIGKLNKKMQQVNKVGAATTRTFHRAGIAVAAGAAVAGAGLANVISIGSDFEQTIAGVGAKLGATGKQFEALSKAAKATGSATEFSASQSAEALNFLAMAGFNADQAISALPGVVDLATSAQIELGQATDVASDALGAFNLMTSDSARLGKNLARVNDVIAKTTTTANTTVEAMFETIKDGAPIATAAGASIETFSALTGVMANAGIKGTKAGTTLKNVFSNLQAPAAAGAKALKRLGIATKDSDGNMRDVIDIVGDLNRSMEGMGGAKRAGFLKDIFGLRAVAGVNVLLAEGADGLREYRRTLENADGASGKMAKTMRDTSSGSMKSFSSAIEGIKIDVFETVKGPFRDIVDSLTKWARANKDVIASGFKDFVNFIRDNGDQIVDILSRVGKAAAVIYGVATAMKVLSGAIWLVNAAVNANPLTLWIVGLTLLAALIVAFWPEISAFFADVGEWIADIAGKIWDKLVGAWDAVVEAVRRVWDSVSPFFVAWAEFYVGALAIVVSILGKIVGAWTTVLGFLFEKLRAFWAGVFEVMQPAFDWLMGVWGKVLDVAIVFFTKLGEWAGIAGGWLVDRFKANLDIIRGFFDLLWSGVAAVFNATVAPILDKIMSVVGSVIGGVRGVGRGVLGGDEDDAPGTRQSPQVASPQERTATLVSEHTERNQSEVTIKDESGRASFSKPPKMGSGISLQHSGAF